MSDYRVSGLDSLHSMLDTSEGWPNPTLPGDFYPQSDLTSLQGLEGDFYRESDVVRGVSLEALSFKAGIEGDFYGCEDDCKGATRGFVASDPYQLGTYGFHDLLDKNADCLSKGCYDDVEGNQVPHLVSHVARFTEADCPPPCPRDPLFSFETTTFFVLDAEPSEIGNHLLDFMGSKVVSSVTKVSRKKYAIKADVFVHSAMCTLKIRVYREPQQQGKYAVEFQRRSGDCVSFNGAFQLAAQYLKHRFVMVENAPEEAAEEPPPPMLGLATGNLDEAAITPLLDLAGQVGLPSLQAESAAALAGIAQDSVTAEHLCSNRAFVEISKLLQSDQTDVAYPTARLLSSLARCPKAQACFSCPGLLLTILEKVRSKRTCQLVQHELAQVLNVAISLCAATLSPDISEEMIISLGAVLQDVGSGRGPLSRNLEEAQHTLKFRLDGGSVWS